MIISINEFRNPADAERLTKEISLFIDRDQFKSSAKCNELSKSIEHIKASLINEPEVYAKYVKPYVDELEELLRR